MRLELKVFKIKDVQFGKHTAFANGRLSINRDELRSLLEEDDRLGKVDIELAHPGEKCRILQVADVMEPRAKVAQESAEGTDQATIGEGKTNVLRGTAVVLSDFRELGKVTTSKDPNGELIDMYGPGAEISPFGNTHNVVVLPHGKDNVGNLDYLAALKIAGLKTSEYLAQTGSSSVPDDIEVYDLPALPDIGIEWQELPKVTYIFQILSLQFQAIPGEPVLYGTNAESILPMILHPNEILDGAVTSALPALNLQTYHIQNHAIVKELYKKHGKDLNFTGVIVTTAPNNIEEYERVAERVASMAKFIIGADGAILTKTGGGAPELVMARTAQKCEQFGVKTALAMLHMGADIKDSRFGASTIFSMPEVDAIVSMGYPFMEINLPQVDRVIGRPGLSNGPPIDGEHRKAIRWIKGSQCQLGSSKLTAVRY